MVVAVAGVNIYCGEHRVYEWSDGGMHFFSCRCTWGVAHSERDESFINQTRLMVPQHLRKPSFYEIYVNPSPDTGPEATLKAGV